MLARAAGGDRQDGAVDDELLVAGVVELNPFGAAIERAGHQFADGYVAWCEVACLAGSRGRRLAGRGHG